MNDMNERVGPVWEAIERLRQKLANTGQEWKDLCTVMTFLESQAVAGEAVGEITDAALVRWLKPVTSFEAGTMLYTAPRPAPVEVIADVLGEVERATEKFPTWPSDPLHAVAVLNEEVGELNKAVLQCSYEPHKSGPKEVREEAIQVAAMAWRFLMSLDRYVYTRGDQHSQAPALAALQKETQG